MFLKRMIVHPVLHQPSPKTRQTAGTCQGRDNGHMTIAPLDVPVHPPHDLSVLNWTHRLSHLGPDFFTPLQPTPLAAPTWAARNEALRTELGWPAALFDETHLQALGGNALMAGSMPLATVYSGHQFGQWAGQLGDGRAIWLGEAQSDHGPQEIQLKGAGRTPYSRGGDGRAVLRSSIREYLCSEAMHGLGIPTTRALSLVASPEPVRRETLETAAVVARVAPSFLRFGHFEHFRPKATPTGCARWPTMSLPTTCPSAASEPRCGRAMCMRPCWTRCKNAPQSCWRSGKRWVFATGS